MIEGSPDGAVEDRRSADDILFDKLYAKRMKDLRDIGQVNPEEYLTSHQGNLTDQQFKDLKRLARTRRIKQIDLAIEDIERYDPISRKLKEEGDTTRGHPLPKPRY